jgi:hypothetical protein
MHEEAVSDYPPEAGSVGHATVSVRRAKRETASVG